MARILGNGAEKSRSGRLGARSLVVRGMRFTNSAAKFWSSLIDELASDYPACEALALDTLTDIILDRDLLFPESSLQVELDKRQSLLNIEEALRESLSQIDLIGPPSSVHVRLLAGGLEIKTCDLPLDCVDAEIFPCLLVWLLEWSEIPHCLWNNDSLTGDFCAKDRQRAVHYRLQFDLVNKHVSEGLYQRTLTLRYTRRA
ncbi:MAG: hypothetical protein KKG09_03610 [Verrucomicrobia bacterium]|nr:hypothetical protein [Verrucomicrobiota bacterium]MCG2678564.1 hypothetical protein [Kiritimatiellia bacterium]MBU4247479.1 hypothetical protein [Verrucomicrobiota bacterium]MBU4292310.1 hypothetical protein [Verrucomicrobiota bacterium]MBU4430410.1 hypothetical protein [Verrucomicrobiota bacterium]